MSFLLDTTAVSELGKIRPDPGFTGWFEGPGRRADAERGVFVSVLVIGELDKGIAKLPDGPSRQSVTGRRDFVLGAFNDRILPIDLEVSRCWGELANRHARLNRTVGAIDELIAATAIVHNLTLVTRNVRHFEHSGCRVLSPWSA